MVTGWGGLPTREAIPDAAQESALVLAPLLVSLPLGFLGFGFDLPSLRPLGGLLTSSALSLLCPALSLLLFVAGYSACGLLHLPLVFVIHRSLFA